MSSPGSARDERGDDGGVVRADEPHGLGDFFRRAEHQMIQADRIDAEFFGDVDHLIERLEALVRDRGVDADTQRRLLAARRRLQPLQPRARPLERAFQAARRVVRSPGTVDRDADVLAGNPAAARSASASARSSLMIVPLVVR